MPCRLHASRYPRDEGRRHIHTPRIERRAPISPRQLIGAAALQELPCSGKTCRLACRRRRRRLRQHGITCATISAAQCCERPLSSFDGAAEEAAALQARVAPAIGYRRRVARLRSPRARQGRA